MRFSDHFFSRENRYSLGFDSKTEVFYISIPVRNRMIEYEEYYALGKQEYENFLVNEKNAAAFAERCRDREFDDRLIIKPGSDRGDPV